MSESRTEPATPRKLARARRQGIVPKSPDLAAAAVLFALLASAGVLGGRFLRALEALWAAALEAAAAPVPPGLERLAAPAREVAWLALAPLLAIALAAALANVVQIGPLFAGRAIALDLRRVDPLQRMRGWFSPQHWLDLLIAAGKASALLAVAVWVLFDARHALTTLAAGTPLRALSVLRAVTGQVVLVVASAAALLGAADLVYRRMQHARALRMSRREWTQEQRESSGLPEQRQLRRRLHAELIAQRELHEACVLLADAQGRAVALAFDAEVDSAPRLVLKAQGELAALARAHAERTGLPVRIEPGLVAALFALEPTESVPRAQHVALAELMRELIASGAMPPLGRVETHDAP